MWNKFKGWIMGVVAALFLFAYILRQAIKAGEHKIQKKNLEEVLDNVKEAKKIDDDNSNMSYDDRIKRMRERSNK